jgi:type IV secretion system protein VirD4
LKGGLLRGCAIGALVAGLATAVVTPFASIALVGTLAVTHLVSHPLTRLGFPRVTWCWWEYLWAYGDDPRFTVKLAVTGGVPLALAGLVTTVAFVRRRPRRLNPARPGQAVSEPDRAPSSLHGNATWMDMDEAVEVFTGPHPRWGGIPVGEAYRPDQDETARPFDEAAPATWGQGGTAPLLQTPLTKGAISGIIIGGSGSYKTMGFTLPVLWAWLGSIVVMDPSQQVGSMVKPMREAMGHQVVLIDPANPKLGSFNPLTCIDTDHLEAADHLTEFVDWCAVGRGNEKPDADENGKTFSEWGKELLFCLLADMMWDTDIPARRKTLREWRSRIVIPEREMPKLLKSVHANSKSSYARDLAGSLMVTHPKTFSGLYRHATSDTKWLSNTAYADLFSGDAFDPRMLTRGDMTIIVQISDGAMQATPAVGRVIIGALARVMLRAQGCTATPVPFILDEMDNLKHMPILAVLRDQGRKGGVALFPMWQSIGQIEDTWGRGGKRSWYASSAWRMYLQVNDEDTAIEVRKRCGTYTALVRTEGFSSSQQNPFTSGSYSRGINDNVSEQPRPLISEYEVQTALRPDEAIIIARGRKALRCGRPLYWRRPDMNQMVNPDRYRIAAE